MRLILASLLVISFSVASMGQASRLNNSESKQDTNSVKHQKQSRNPDIHKARSRWTAHNSTKQGKHHAYQIGRASFYAKKFHGRKTASGEKYDMFQFTAAHKQLPLGTYVKVTNLHNGRWVVVKVNDRGPVPQSRIIDLSYGAAEMLNMRSDGVEQVRLDVVEPSMVAQARAEEQEVAGLQ